MRSNTGRWADLFLMFAILFGAIVRFAPTVLAHTTINDGGMFFAMIEDIKANGFLLPAFTSYNHIGIPFAYPPLSLYIGALLSAMGIQTSDVIRWLPPLVSTISIPAFYWMTSQILDSRSTAALSTVAYALIPRSFSWYVMGGGLSRSFGILFLLLTCGSAWRLFAKPGWRGVALTALFGAGTVLSHPETGLHAFAACVLIWTFRGRSKGGVRAALMVGAGVFLLTTPWWVTVLVQHRFAPFQAVLNAGGHSAFFWTPLLTMDFAEERFATVLTVLGLLGLAVQCIRRDWFLAAWLVLPFIVEPRSAQAISALALAILAGIGLGEFVIPRLASLASKSALQPGDWTGYMASSRAARIVAGYVLFSALVGAFAYDISLSNYVVREASQEAMQWVRTNSPADTRFLVLTGQADPFSDAVAEWFPLMTQRTSVNTIQGQEWTLGKNFIPFLNDLAALEGCENAGPSCLQKWASTHNVSYDDIYIEKPLDPNSPVPSGLLAFQLRQDANYQLVFENAGVVIFARR